MIMDGLEGLRLVVLHFVAHENQQRTWDQHSMNNSAQLENYCMVLQIFLKFINLIYVYTVYLYNAICFKMPIPV